MEDEDFEYIRKLPHGYLDDLDVAERTRDLSCNVVVAGAMVVETNKYRTALWLVNASDTDIQVGLGWLPIATGGSESGVQLKANGGSLEINISNLFKGEVYARHSGTGNKRLCIVELESRYANL